MKKKIALLFVVAVGLVAVLGYSISSAKDDIKSPLYNVRVSQANEMLEILPNKMDSEVCTNNQVADGYYPVADHQVIPPYITIYPPTFQITICLPTPVTVFPQCPGLPQEEGGYHIMATASTIILPPPPTTTPGPPCQMPRTIGNGCGGGGTMPTAAPCINLPCGEV